jgi:hypothetical protein
MTKGRYISLILFLTLIVLVLCAIGWELISPLHIVVTR